jgi:NAD(P)-dependent dehydrogenase (short-subunit alcohol dehydrogenase family)
MEITPKFNKMGTVVITGGNGMLGRQYARAIEEMGGFPISLDIKEPDEKIGLWIYCDITDEEEVEDAFDNITFYPGFPIVGLINNAAIDPKFDKSINETPKCRLEAYPLEQWHKELNVGLTGAFICSKIFGSYMATQGKGSIINISSVLGLVAPNQALYRDPNLPEEQQNVKPVTYSVIKHGIIGLTRYCASYWANRNVRCNCLCPGGVYNNHPPEFVEKLSKYIPLGRMANKYEYNEAIKFLLSDASSFMTGSVLTIDGGQTCW